MGLILRPRRSLMRLAAGAATATVAYWDEVALLEGLGLLPKD